ncbi:MAG: class 1 fructose-bisphosphatase [Halobacteriales archaeon]|nr:class 1 fructose-bisphosphatase [Halobacteriales archaeon]
MSNHEIAETVIETVAAAAPEIRAGLPGRRTAVNGENPSDEIQMAADIWADELLCDRLTAIDGVGTYASEERADPVHEGDGLSVSVDPLDGSSNLQSNNAMGTIVGVYADSVPAPGTELIASGYVLYGPITTMTVAIDGQVTEYVIEDTGAIRPVETDVTLPSDPVVFGFGGRQQNWTDGFHAFAEEIREELKLRYGGAMIADVNQVVTYGGIFSYPGLVDRPEGKLRLQFEGAPIAYVLESAGGASTDGDRSLIEKTPEELHERTPVHLGNQALIDRVEAALD